MAEKKRRHSQPIRPRIPLLMCFTYDRVHKRHFGTPLSLFRVFVISSVSSYAVLRDAQTLRRHVSRIKMSRLKIRSLFCSSDHFRPPLSHIVVVTRSSVGFWCSIRGVVADARSLRRRMSRGTFLYLDVLNYDNVSLRFKKHFWRPLSHILVVLRSSLGRPKDALISFWAAIFFDPS